MLSHDVRAYNGRDESCQNFEDAHDAVKVKMPSGIHRLICARADDDTERESVKRLDHLTLTPPGGGAPEPIPSGGSMLPGE